MSETTTLTDAEVDSLNALANDNREQKALTEGMYVAANYGWARGDPNRFLVYKKDDTTVYRVHTLAEACSCKDQFHRGTFCKHLRRVDYVRGVRDLPPRTEDRIDARLARQLPDGDE